MATAIIGLAGALLGALTTLLGTVLNDRRQARREEARWRRDQRSAAYDGTLRYLLRAANLRSEFTGGGGMAVVVQEHQREWFDDLVHAQFWLHQLVRYCGKPQQSRLQAAAEHLDLHVARLVAAESYEGKGFSILAVLRESIAAVEASAREEYGNGRPSGKAHGQPDSGSPGETHVTQGSGDQIAPSSAGGTITSSAMPPAAASTPPGAAPTSRAFEQGVSTDESAAFTAQAGNIPMVRSNRMEELEEALPSVDRTWLQSASARQIVFTGPSLTQGWEEELRAEREAQAQGVVLRNIMFAGRSPDPVEDLRAKLERLATQAEKPPVPRRGRRRSAARRGGRRR